MEQNNEYNPIGCDHKLPSGFTAWQMHSESIGSGPDFDEHMTICVCIKCGDIKIMGRKWDSKKQQTNYFDETFHIYVPKAIDAIIKQANFFNEEAKWCRADDYASLKAKCERYEAALKEAKETINWMWQHMKEPDGQILLRVDEFNRPANALHIIDEALSAGEGEKEEGFDYKSRELERGKPAPEGAIKAMHERWRQNGERKKCEDCGTWFVPADGCPCKKEDKQ